MNPNVDKESFCFNISTLDVCRLQKELAIVKTENAFLRESITQLVFEDTSTSKTPKSLSDIQRRKWAFYHENKDEIAQQTSVALGIPVDVISWCVVKRKSDEKFHRTFGHTLTDSTDQGAATDTTDSGN
jgi:hypothetical protein